MGDSIRVARIAGIRIGINWSLLLVFSLVTWQLASERLPLDVPGHGDLLYWISAALIALLLFTSLVGHELAHAITARRRGIEVEGITLWLFGGIARLKSDDMTPRDELIIALAGPVASVLAALLLWVVAVVLRAWDGPELAAWSATWLARINAVLAGFNLVPAFPLDGGRMLRAWLSVHRDRARATALAAAAGRWFGYLLMGVGALQLGSRGAFNGLWLFFLGWFLLQAARAEEAHALARAVLRRVSAADVMRTTFVVGRAEESLADFLRRNGGPDRLRSCPVRDSSGSIVGVLSADTLTKSASPRARDAPLSSLVVPLEEVPVAAAAEALLGVVARMEAAGSPALVMDDGDVIGVVLAEDVASALQGASARKGTPQRSLRP